MLSLAPWTGVFAGRGGTAVTTQNFVSLSPKEFSSTDICVLHTQRKCTQRSNQLKGWKWTQNELWQMTARPAYGDSPPTAASLGWLIRSRPWSRPGELCEWAKALRKKPWLSFPGPFTHPHPWMFSPPLCQLFIRESCHPAFTQHDAAYRVLYA